MAGFYSSAAVFRDRRRATRFSSSVDIARDPYFANVVNLLQFNNVPDASTIFLDTTGAVWTASGSAQIDTAQFRFGTGSVLFDGSADKITSPLANAAYTFMHDGSVWCAEFWIRPNALSSSALFTNNRGSSASTGIYIGADSSGHLRVIMTRGAGVGTQAFDFTSTLTVSAGAFQHIAIVHDPTQAAPLNTYIGGASAGTSAALSTYGSSAPSFVSTIGCTDNSSNGYNGWVDSFRLTSGVPRYTGAFSPPGLPFSSM